MQSFKEQMESIPSTQVASMVRSINAALNHREAYERQKAPNGAHVELRDVIGMLRGNSTVARFLIVLGADPDVMLNKQRKAGYRANLKPIRKIRMLAEYMAGEHGAVNGVVKALFAATIMAAKLKTYWLSNDELERILARIPLMDVPEELRVSIQAWNAVNIKSGAESRNQACQFRTAFENLGCYIKSREDMADLNKSGIYANMNNPLIQDLAKRWNLV